MSFWLIFPVIALVLVFFGGKLIALSHKKRGARPPPNPSASPGDALHEQQREVSSTSTSTVATTACRVELNPIYLPHNELSDTLRARLEPPPTKALRIELIPKQMHGENARAVLTDETWNKIRNLVHASNGRRCSECGSEKDLECHEVWNYEWVRRNSENIPVMRLVGLRTLCRLCHGGKHIGCAGWQGTLPQVRAHLRAFYGLSEEQPNAAIREAEENVRKLYCTKQRELDLTHLNNERFARIIGRQLSENEIMNCRAKETDS